MCVYIYTYNYYTCMYNLYIHMEGFVIGYNQQYNKNMIFSSVWNWGSPLCAVSLGLWWLISGLDQTRLTSHHIWNDDPKWQVFLMCGSLARLWESVGQDLWCWVCHLSCLHLVIVAHLWYHGTDNTSFWKWCCRTSEDQKIREVQQRKINVEQQLCKLDIDMFCIVNMYTICTPTFFFRFPALFASLKLNVQIDRRKPWKLVRHRSLKRWAEPLILVIHQSNE